MSKKKDNKPKSNMSTLGLTKLNQTQLKAKQGLDQMRANWSLMQEAAELNAKNKKEQFDQFIKAGFTEKQALELIK